MPTPHTHARRLRELVPLLLLAALAGGLVATSMTSMPGRAQEQEPEACAQWDVATFLPNSDDARIELLPLGVPRPLEQQYALPFPRTEDEAVFTLPQGWEPIGMGAAAGQMGEAVVIARRCSA